MESKVFAEMTELVSLPIAFGCGASPKLTSLPQNKSDVYVILLLYQGGIISTQTLFSVHN